MNTYTIYCLHSHDVENNKYSPFSRLSHILPLFCKNLTQNNTVRRLCSYVLTCATGSIIVQGTSFLWCTYYILTAFQPLRNQTHECLDILIQLYFSISNHVLHLYTDTYDSCIFCILIIRLNGRKVNHTFVDNYNKLHVTLFLVVLLPQSALLLRIHWFSRGAVVSLGKFTQI